MSGRIILSTVLVLLSGSTLGFAQGFAQRPPIDPYKKLFQQPSLEKAALQQQVQEVLRQAQARQQRPRVVCGMTLLPADPVIDPKMAIEPPSRDGVRHTIRAIEPPACWIPEAERK